METKCGKCQAVLPNPEAACANCAFLERQQQTPAQPQLRARMVLSLYEDGNFTVEGPMEDRLMYRGLLGLAEEAGMFHTLQANAIRQREEAARIAATPRKSPGLIKRFLQATSGKKEAPGGDRLKVAREAREEATRLAAKRAQDEKAVASGTGASEPHQSA